MDDFSSTLLTSFKRSEEDGLGYNHRVYAITRMTNGECEQFEVLVNRSECLFDPDPARMQFGSAPLAALRNTDPETEEWLVPSKPYALPLPVGARGIICRLSTYIWEILKVGVSLEEYYDLKDKRHNEVYKYIMIP